MRLEQLEYLIKISETGSLSQAGTKLFVSQQALSSAIKNLEDELGTQLLERSFQGVALTDAGQYVLQAAQKVESILQEVREHFIQQAPPIVLNGQFEIATTEMIKSYQLAKPISYIYSTYPQLQLKLHIAPNEQIIEMVATREVMVGIINVLLFDKQCVMDIPPELVFTIKREFRFNLRVSIHSPLAKYKTVSMANALKYPFIVMFNGNVEHYLIYQILLHYGTPNILLVDNKPLATQMVADNLGIALTTSHQDNNDNNTVCIPLRNNLNVRLGYLLHQDQPEHPLLQEFLARMDT